MDSLASPRPALTQPGPNSRETQNGLARPFADLLFFEAEHADLTISSGDDRHGFAICLQTRGEGRVSHDNTSISLAIDEIIVFARPSCIAWHPTADDSRSLIVAGGQAFSLRFQPYPQDAVRLAALHPISVLLRDYLKELRTFAPTANARVRQKLAETLADLIYAAVEDAHGLSSTRRFLVKLARAEQYLDDPGFDPLALAAKCGISLRALQKQFKRLDTTPRRWILARRLERIRNSFDDPTLANLPIQKIAARTGLRDFSHFIHAFKDAFGVSPGRYRRWT